MCNLLKYGKSQRDLKHTQETAKQNTAGCSHVLMATTSMDNVT